MIIWSSQSAVSLSSTKLTSFDDEVFGRRSLQPIASEGERSSSRNNLRPRFPTQFIHLSNTSIGRSRRPSGFDAPEVRPALIISAYSVSREAEGASLRVVLTSNGRPMRSAERRQVGGSAMDKRVGAKDDGSANEKLGIRRRGLNAVEGQTWTSC